MYPVFFTLGSLAVNRFVPKAVIVLICLAGSLSAEEQGLVTLSYRFTPKDGQTEQFVAAVTEHLEWLRENNEPWSWSAFSIGTGEHVGSFLFVTRGHTWKDLDAARAHRKTAVEHWRATVSRYIESFEARIHELDTELSRLPKSSGPSRLARVKTIHLKPFARIEFKQQLQSVSQAIKQQDAPPPVFAFWLESGSSPTLTFVYPLDSWEQTPRINDALTQAAEALGSEAGTIISQLRELTERTEDFVLISVPELGYEADDAVKELAKN